MTPRLVPRDRDSIRPASPTPLSITLDGVQVNGLAGQSVAGVLLASGTLGFRRTSTRGQYRGVFCGIGVCFDCLVEVNGDRDVRACQRRAAEGDIVKTQHDPLPSPGEHAGRDHPVEAPGHE